MVGASVGFDAVYQQALPFLVSKLGELKARQALGVVTAIEDPLARAEALEWAVRSASVTNDSELALLQGMVRLPVSIKVFIESDEYLGMEGQIYPAVMQALEEINSGWYQEAILTGAIGTGKTTIALITTIYQLYVLSCYRDPHRLFGLDSSSEILFVFQSITATLAKSVDYARFKTMVERSPYFREFFPFDRTILSELRFPNRIIVKPVSGSDTAAIGQNVFGGVIDEMNFMAVVQKSKSMGAENGVYNQAMALYNSIARRRKSRFMKKGRLPGVLCLVSSKRYPGQFTDLKQEERDREVARLGRSTIYVYDRTTWDVKPDGTFSGDWFRVFVGDETRKPRILSEDESIPLENMSLVIDVPEEYRKEFEQDIMNALRDIAGVSTLAKHPFILEAEAIGASMKRTESVFNLSEVDFVYTKATIYPNRIHKPSLPRFIHMDLALTGDAAGMAIGTVTGFRSVDRGDTIEMLPEIWIDGVLRVVPPRNGEIQLFKLREIIYALKKLGMNVRWITCDTYQSVDMLQILRQNGYTVGFRSVDTSIDPYNITKAALYDGRIDQPKHHVLARELASLERDVKKNRVDHPVSGSKDCADALAGVVYGLTTMREIWGMYHVPIMRVPSVLRAAVGSGDMKEPDRQPTNLQVAGRHDAALRSLD